MFKFNKIKFCSLSIKCLTALICCLIITQNASACELTFENPSPNITVITTPGGAKFKIEDKYIKTLLPTAFSQEKWTFIPIVDGVSRITGILEEGDSDKVISSFVSFKMNGQVHWYLTVNRDLESGQGSWIVASSINNKISCSTERNFQKVEISDSVLGRYPIKEKTLSIQAPGYIYQRLGLS